MDRDDNMLPPLLNSNGGIFGIINSMIIPTNIPSSNLPSRNPPFINTAQAGQGFNIFRNFDSTFFSKPIIEQLFYVSKIIGLRTTNSKLQSNNRGKIMRIDKWPVCGIHHFINTYGDLPVRMSAIDIRAACDVKRVLTGDIVCNLSDY